MKHLGWVWLDKFKALLVVGSKSMVNNRPAPAEFEPRKRFMAGMYAEEKKMNFQFFFKFFL
jgi:hypothetical protein